MKQIGNTIVGDPVKIDNYTSKWHSMKISPSVFYRKYNEIQQTLDKLNGLYVQIDYENCIVIKFSDFQDLENFSIEETV